MHTQTCLSWYHLSLSTSAFIFLGCSSHHHLFPSLLFFVVFPFSLQTSGAKLSHGDGDKVKRDRLERWGSVMKTHFHFWLSLSSTIFHQLQILIFCRPDKVSIPGRVKATSPTTHPNAHWWCSSWRRFLDRLIVMRKCDWHIFDVSRKCRLTSYLSLSPLFYLSHLLIIPTAPPVDVFFFLLCPVCRNSFLNSSAHLDEKESEKRLTRFLFVEGNKWEEDKHSFSHSLHPYIFSFVGVSLFTLTGRWSSCEEKRNWG